MKYILTALLLSFLTAAVSAGNVYRVAPEGSAANSGDSWSATMDLVTALNRAQAGDEIWVKRGTYFTSATNDRAASFRLKAGVLLFGGFSGTESSTGERSRNSRSVLSGNIGAANSPDDNAYTVLMLLAGADRSSIVDGFVVTGGTARSFTQGFSTGNAGGGLYIAAPAGTNPSHQISNCVITGNVGHNGAGVYVAGGSPSFDACEFAHNIADFMGGGVYNQGAGGEVSVRFTDCTFEDNGADYGGAMANNGENGVAAQLALRCEFRFNVARSNGSVAYNMMDATGESNLITESCGFDNNPSILGDVIATKGNKKSLSQRQKDSQGAKVIVTGQARK